MQYDVKKELSRFLAEDIGRGDLTSALLPERKIVSRIISRENAIVAGARYAKEIFKLKGCTVKILKKDGRRISNQDTL